MDQAEALAEQEEEELLTQVQMVAEAELQTALQGLAEQAIQTALLGQREIMALQVAA